MYKRFLTHNTTDREETKQKKTKAEYIYEITIICRGILGAFDYGAYRPEIAIMKHYLERRVIIYTLAT